MIVVGDTVRVIRDPRDPNRAITIRNPGIPGMPKGKPGDITICHDALCDPPDDPRAACQCDAFVFEIGCETRSPGVAGTIIRRKGCAGITVQEIIDGDLEHQEGARHQERVRDAWRRLKPHGLFGETDKQAELELITESLAIEVPADRLHAIAKICQRYDGYEPDTCGPATLFLNLYAFADDSLKRIQANGWQPEELEAWYVEGERMTAARAGRAWESA